MQLTLSLGRKKESFFSMSKKQILVVFLWSAMLIHFSFSLIYNLQELPVPEKMRHMSNMYVAPFFHQNWKLFAPTVPEYSTDLEVRYFNANGWTTWSDARAAAGFDEHSRIEYIEQTICTSLGWQVANNFYFKNQLPQLDHILASQDYQRAVYYAWQLGKHAGLQMDSLQLRMPFRFIPAPDAARTVQLSTLQFPAIATPHD
jgi:hypothetical protein